MDIGKEFWRHLTTDATLTALVKDRIHRNTVPKTDRVPFLWYRVSGGIGDGCLDAEAGADPAITTIDCECVADSLDSALAVAARIKALDNYRGTLGETTVAGMFAADASDDYQQHADYSDNGWHVVAVQVEIYR